MVIYDPMYQKEDNIVMVDDHLRQAQELLEQLPPSREISIVKTKTDEARMWLEKSQRRDSGPQRNTAPRK